MGLRVFDCAPIRVGVACPPHRAGMPVTGKDDVTKATDKASCDKAGGVWDDTAKKCSAKQ